MEECSKRVAEWLHACEHEHDGCRNPVIAQAADAEATLNHERRDLPLSTRLVHVSSSEDGQTVYLRCTVGFKRRYCTLSYSWGRSKSFKTTRATYQRRLDGFSVNEYGQRVADSHQRRCLPDSLTRFLVLMVDALCIQKAVHGSNPVKRLLLILYESVREVGLYNSEKVRGLYNSEKVRGLYNSKKSEDKSFSIFWLALKGCLPDPRHDVPASTRCRLFLRPTCDAHFAMTLETRY